MRSQGHESSSLSPGTKTVEPRACLSAITVLRRGGTRKRARVRSEASQGRSTTVRGMPKRFFSRKILLGHSAEWVARAGLRGARSDDERALGRVSLPAPYHRNGFIEPPFPLLSGSTSNASCLRLCSVQTEQADDASSCRHHQEFQCRFPRLLVDSIR